MCYKIKYSDDITVNSVTDDGRLLITYPLDTDENREKKRLSGYDAYAEDVYLVNIDGTNAIYLGSYMFDPVLSPDGRFIAYVKLNGPGSEDYKNAGLNDMEYGFYINNIETNQTCFYPFVNPDNPHPLHNAVSWISCDSFKKSFVEE